MSMSMSCSSPPQDHHRMRPPALDLLDEYWFFSNTLANSSNNPPLLPRSPASSSTSTSTKDRERGDKGSSSAGPSRFHASSGARRLLRTPSLPSPRPRKEDDDLPDLVVEQQPEENADGSGSGNRREEAEAAQGEVEVDDDDLNWSSIYEGVLRTRMAEGSGGGRSSALRRAPSMPVPSSSATDHQIITKSTPSMPRLRTPPSGEQRRITTQQRQQQPVLARSKSVFHDKKWRSSSDLESIEVQGFRDLGFVFDKEELRESLAGVLPGLKQPSGDSSNRRHRSSSRPYLSEAWQRPALVRVQSDAKSSAAEMKDQLRMWAQAVACNVRQEC